MDNLVEIIVSVAGARATTDAMEQITGRTSDMASELTKLAGISLTIGATIDSLKDAFDWGGQLADLSARTGQSVTDLVVIGRAFEIAGMQSTDAAASINKLQRAIGGINEIGQATGSAFAALGLDPNSLQGRSAVDQMQALTDGFERIQNPAQRTAVAMQIFGREGGQMLQLFQNGTLSQAANDAGRLAERMQENAARFDAVGDRLQVFGLRIREMAVVAVEKLMPALEGAANFADKINLSALGAGGITAAMSGLGIGIGNIVTKKLDEGIMEWATSQRAGNTFAERFLLPLSSGLRNLFQVALPGLIIVGIADAIASAITQDVLDNIRKKASAQIAFGNVTAAPLAGMSSARTTEEYEASRAQARALLEKSQAELETLMKGTRMKDEQGFEWVIQPDKKAVEAMKGRIKALQAAVDVEADPARLASNMAASVDAQLQPLVLRMQELREARDKAINESLSTETKAGVLRGRINDLELALSGPKMEGVSDQAWEAQKLDWQRELIESKTKLGQLDKQLASDEKREMDEILAKKKAASDLSFAVYKTETEMEILRAKAAGDTTKERELTTALKVAEAKRELTEAGITDLSIAEKRVALEEQLKQKEKEREAMRNEANLMYRATQTSIANNSTALGLIEENSLLTDAELYAIKVKALENELALRRQNIDYLERQARLASQNGDSEGFREFSNMADQERQAEGGAQLRRAQLGPDPNNFSAQWSRSLQNLRSQWQVTAQTVSQSLEGIANGGIKSISQGLTNVIMGTMTWNQALAMIGTTILTSIISAIVEMGVRWLAFEIMKAVLGPQLQMQAHAAMLAMSVPMAAAQSLVWSGPATLATIATMGGAAMAAPAQVMLAKTATMGLAAFKSGGWSGDADEDAVTGVTHGREVIFSAPAVRQLGKDNLLSLHASALSSGTRSGQSAMQSAVSRMGGGSTSSSKNETTVLVVDDRSRGDNWRRKRRGPSKMIDLLERNGGL